MEETRIRPVARFRCDLREKFVGGGVHSDQCIEDLAGYLNGGSFLPLVRVQRRNVRTLRPGEGVLILSAGSGADQSNQNGDQDE